MRLASEVIVLDAGDAELHRHLEEAVAAVEDVHAFPDHSRVIPVSADDSLLTEARYTPSLIRIHPERPRRRIALLHEVGHFLDDQVLVAHGRATSSPLLEPWRRAVLRSDAILRLRELARSPPVTSAGQHLNYLLRFTETFARTYVQWIALRSRSGVLLEEVGEAQIALNYGEFWAFDDFDEIAEALDEAFGGLR
jgi:hypothetical protein